MICRLAAILRRGSRWAALFPAVLGGIGCASGVQAPSEAVTPDAEENSASTGPTISDPNNPHTVLLQRQLQQSWSARTDKDGQLAVPLVDADNWKRVRYWAVDHLVGFKYGDDLNALNIVMVFDLPAGVDSTPKECMRVAETWGRQRLRDFQVQLGTVQEDVVRWRKQNILVHRSFAEVAVGFDSKQFSAAWAAYPAYPHACLLFAQAIPWDGERALAEAVLDRWINEGVARLTPLTEDAPKRR
jgi:hypothetical protein